MKSIGPLNTIPHYSQPSAPAGRGGQQLQPGEPGQLLRAQVIETRPDNSILLQIGDNRLLARSETSLQPGQQLQLQLVATSPQIELKIVNESLQQFFGRPLILAGNTIDISSLLSFLQQPPAMLDGLSLTSRQALLSFSALQQNDLSGKEGGATLKQLVSQLGLTLERLLAAGEGSRGTTTIKAVLLELLNAFKAESQLTALASKNLATLEFFQLAQLHADSGQQLIFPLPLTFIEHGFLLIEQHEDDQGRQGDYQDEEFRFSLFVRMTELGNIRVDFVHSPGGLFIRFQTDSQEKAEFIESYSEELKQHLSESPLLGISFTAGAPDPAAELIRRIVPEGRAVLNTTA